MLSGMEIEEMTREQANNPDLVRGFKCGSTGPKIYLGLITREEVSRLQWLYSGTGVIVWHQAKVT